LSRDGQSLVYSSFIGGDGEDNATSLSVDANGAAFIGGMTTSRDFPMRNPFQHAYRGLIDGFVAKVAPQGTELEYSTYLGGSNQELLENLALDADGSVVVVGATGSRDFPRKYAIQKTYGGSEFDGFVTKLNPAGNGLAYSTFLGGAGGDLLWGVALDTSGAAFVVGRTDGTFPLMNPFQNKRKGAIEAVVLKIAPNGKSLVYSSYMGGSSNDSAGSIAVDGRGTAYFVGSTKSANFPLKNAYQWTRRGSQDAYLAIVDPGGAKLLYATLLGGSVVESAYAVALGASGVIYLGGYTNSPDFPTAGKRYQNELSGGNDGFVVRFTLGDTAR
jgi:hypothetical protein